MPARLPDSPFPDLRMSHAHAVAVLDQLASQTWRLLRACYDRGIRIDEDAITTQLLIAIATQLGGTLLMADGRKDERRTGCDFELWVSDHGSGWRAYVVQAKRVTVPTAAYQKLCYRVGKSGPLQHDLLRVFAGARRATPLYLFYNHWDPTLVPAGSLRYAATAPTDHRFGCSVTSLHTAKLAMHRAGARNYPWLHAQASTKRWSSLLNPSAAKPVLPVIAPATAGIANSRGSSTGEESDEAGGIDVDAIVDSNEHAELPAYLQPYANRPGVHTVREGEGVELVSRATLMLGRNAVG